MAYVVLVSGAGSNLEALIDADVGKISTVVADVDCPALGESRSRRDQHPSDPLSRRPFELHQRDSR